MIRISLFATLIICVSISLATPSVYGQEAGVMVSGATIRGKVIEATSKQKPIEGATVTIFNTATDATYTVKTDKDGTYEKTGLPHGRYTLAIAKKGYGNRVGKSKVVAAGGEIFDTIKMRKNETIITFFLNRIFTGQLLVGFLVGFAIGFFVASILNSRPSRV